MYATSPGFTLATAFVQPVPPRPSNPVPCKADPVTGKLALFTLIGEPFKSLAIFVPEG